MNNYQVRGDYSQSNERNVTTSNRDWGLSSQRSLDVTVSTLCETCEKMAQTFRLEIDEGTSERDIDACQTGAIAGCPLCLIAWRDILKLRQPETTENKSRVTRMHFRFNNYYEHSRTFWFHITAEDGDGLTRKSYVNSTLGFHPLLGLNLRTAELAAKYEYPPRTDAESVAKLIQSWYLRCTTQHSECASQVSTYRPPRIVEIQKGGFRLVVTSECQTESSYATLSHCWGNAPDFLKLTSTNIEQLRQWNPTNRLPQTFQDATRLCIHLQIKYLWIDSLCILQDGDGSSEDWALHVTEMRTIYSNGVLNIAASRAAASNESMYTSRNSDFIKPLIIQGNNRFGLSNELYLLVLHELSEPGDSCPPLNERGWVFQERLLSPRVIHFEREQVFWECSASALCETYQAGFNETFGRGRTAPPFELPTKQTCSGFAERWKNYVNFVEHYYYHRFTFPNKDKLAAFGGIAQHISREFNDEYFAGMFRSQLPFALLWHAVDWYPKQDANQLREFASLPQSSSDNEYRCPSWSWAKMNTSRPIASVSGMYGLDLNSLSKHYVTIHDVKAMPVDSKNPFGNLKSAFIILEGLLLPWMTEHEMPDRIVNMFDGEEEACIDPKELFIIPFFAQLREDKNKSYILYFLIVHRLSTENQESYRRVGKARLSRDPGWGVKSDIEEQTKGLSTIDEIFEADVVWRKYVSPVAEKRIVLI